MRAHRVADRAGRVSGEALRQHRRIVMLFISASLRRIALFLPHHGRRRSSATHSQDLTARTSPDTRSMLYGRCRRHVTSPETVPAPRLSPGYCISRGYSGFPAPQGRRSSREACRRHWSKRNVLCVFPHYSPSFGTFENAYPFIGVDAFMPPQGILVIANYMPANWDVRFIDENVRKASKVPRTSHGPTSSSRAACTSRRPQINDINRARARPRASRPSSAGRRCRGSPSYYPDFDYLHVGELGDATDELVRRLTESTARPGVADPARDEGTAAARRVPGARVRQGRRFSKYFLGSVQFSSGCPYQLRVLRHPGALREQPEAQGARADHRRARHDPRERRRPRDLLRRRQLRRQS